jgi:hypothetical protein
VFKIIFYFTGQGSEGVKGVTLGFSFGGIAGRGVLGGGVVIGFGVSGGLVSRSGIVVGTAAKT